VSKVNSRIYLNTGRVKPIIKRAHHRQRDTDS